MLIEQLGFCEMEDDVRLGRYDLGKKESCERERKRGDIYDPNLKKKKKKKKKFTSVRAKSPLKWRLVCSVQ